MFKKLGWKRNDVIWGKPVIFMQAPCLQNYYANQNEYHLKVGFCKHTGCEEAFEAAPVNDLQPG